MEYAFASQRIRVDSMDSEDITFAGPGDPILELGAIARACQRIKEMRHGQGFRLLTSGLVPAADLESTIALFQVRHSTRTVKHQTRRVD